jgi:hypothetical protein
MNIPRTVDEILGNADELAAPSERYEPRDADELDAAAVAALRAAVQERSTAERHVLAAVRAPRRGPTVPRWASVSRRWRLRRSLG